jgi:DNA-binding transcriptional regulator YiaG
MFENDATRNAISVNFTLNTQSLIFHRDMMNKIKDPCIRCHSGLVFNGFHGIQVKIGKHLTSNYWVTFPKCSQCGYYELTYEQDKRLDVYSTLHFLKKFEEIDGPILRHARSILGFKKPVFARIMECSVDRIRRLESSRSMPTSQYVKKLIRLLRNF